jgi:hypothetical protein
MQKLEKFRRTVSRTLGIGWRVVDGGRPSHEAHRLMPTGQQGVIAMGPYVAPIEKI